MDSQIVVPSSFVALFVPPGRLKPNAPHSHIAQRYELCEDLAQLLTEQARELLWKLGVDESDVLERMHRGLAGGDAGLEPGEALWVARRLAELLDWAWPAWMDLGGEGGAAPEKTG
jgi:hypothetical protein